MRTSQLLDEGFYKLRDTIDAYCDMIEVSSGSSSDERIAAAHDFARVFQDTLPDLAKTFDTDWPNTVYAERVIEFGVAGLGSEVATLLWKEHILASGTNAYVAYRLHLSKRTVNRQRRAFPELVAAQLWKKNHELASMKPKNTLNPVTVEQQRKSVLKDTFLLSDREAEVLLAFWRGRNRGRADIVAELSIAKNTLKTHIRNIIRKMGVERMNEAVAKAYAVFRKNPLLDWQSADWVDE